MLAGVLLHVVEAARPVDAAFNATSGERTVNDVEDAVIGVPHIHDVGVAQFAKIVGLTARSRVEQSLIEEYAPPLTEAAFFTFAERFATENLGGEIVLKGIVVVEPAGRHIKTSLAQRIRASFRTPARVGQRAATIPAKMGICRSGLSH